MHILVVAVLLLFDREDLFELDKLLSDLSFQISAAMIDSDTHVTERLMCKDSSIVVPEDDWLLA